MGQMSRLACDASIDFARFAAEHGCTLYCSAFLKCGFTHWPTAFQKRYSGLKHWNGVCQFRDELRHLAGADRESEVLLSSRSAVLVKFAARLLSGPCRNVLITDTIWPAYKNILQREFGNGDCRFTQIPVRRKLLRESISVDELIELFVFEYRHRKCDGLFLPLVDNLGVRLPIERIVDRIKGCAELRFVVVDGAQSIGHVPLRLDRNYCDLLIAGTHKWLRAYHTMGLGFYGNPGSRHYITKSLQGWTAAGLIDDPLLTFVEELTTGRDSHFGETVQVAPLIAANAATRDALSRGCRKSTDKQIDTASIINLVGEVGWRALSPEAEMSSRIILFELKNSCRVPESGSIRRSLLAQGVAATVYPTGLLRISLPESSLTANCLRQLRAALSSIGSESGYYK